MGNGPENNSAPSVGVQILSRSPEETERLGRLIGETAKKGLFVALNGDLGSGKTALTRGIARGLGIEGEVTSPTFQLMREYSGRMPLYHFDFYRIGSAGEIVDMDLAGCLDAGIVVAEWSDRFEEFESGDFLEIRLEWTGESERRITIQRTGGDGAALVGIMKPVLAELARKDSAE